MMKILVATLLVYALGLLFTAVGSRLAGRCTTWCCALLGLPMWVVGGTVAPFCLALPQLMLAFLAAGMSVTALAVGTALAGAVTNLGLALSVCLLRKRHCAVADRDSVIAAAGGGKREVLGKRVSPQLEEVLESRRVYQRTEGQSLPVVEGSDRYLTAVAAPILSEGDLLGLVILAGQEPMIAVGDTEYKLAQTIAAFLGRHMES